MCTLCGCTATTIEKVGDGKVDLHCASCGAFIVRK